MREKSVKAAALKYRHGRDSAPRLTAKGKGQVAERILEIAHKYNIPIREDKELIEVLSSLDLYQEIPPELYKAVAEILAFVYFLSRKHGNI